MSDTRSKPLSLWEEISRPLWTFAFMVLLLMVMIPIWMKDGEEKRQKELEQLQVHHDNVMVTTYDASGGSGLLRARHAMVYNPDGSCTITVQRYERRSAKDLFVERPRIETTVFTPKQCEQ